MLVLILFGGFCNNYLFCFWVLVLGNIEKDIEEVKGLVVEKCYNIFKLKIGFCLVCDDVVYVGKIKVVLGDDVSIWVDVN